MQGLLPIAVASRRSSAPALMFPAGNLHEAGIIDGLRLFPVRSLFDATRVLAAPHPEPAAAPARRADDASSAAADDLADVHGQLAARRALEIAAAGGHHVLFSGPPGAGKTMLARRLPGLLPRLSFADALTVTTIHSVGGTLAAGRRPDRHAALSRAASHLLGRRAGRRRQHSASRRAQPGPRRRPVPRRAAGVQPPRAREPASAARTGRRAHRARQPIDGVSRARHARRRDEPVSVRLSRRRHARVPLHPVGRGPLSAAVVRAAARSIRSRRRGARRALEGPAQPGLR